MADVAQLGIAVDSRQAKTATQDLKGLAAAAGTAEQASARLATASGQAGTSIRSIETMAKRAGVSVDEMRARVQGNHDALNKMAGASQTAQKAMINLSTQAKQAANDNQDLGKKTEVATRSLDLFAQRFMRGFIAAAAITAVREVGQYVWNLNAALAATADTAQRIGVGGQQFQGLQTAAGYKGITNDAFNSAMLGFNQQVDLAKRGLGDLRTLLSSNGKVVSDTATTFGVVADLVRNASSEAQKFSILQQAGLPATTQMVKLLEQGGAAIQKQSDAAKKLTDQQLDDARRVNERWQQMWVDFENWGKRAVVNTMDAMKGLSVGGLPQERAPTRVMITGGTVVGGPTGQPTFNPELAKQQIALEQQRLGLLGQTATVSQQVRSVELAIQQARLNNVSITAKEADNLKRLAQENALGITQIKASADAWRVEAATIGMNTGEALAYTAVQNKINEARRNGITLTQDNINQLQREATELGRAAQSAENTRFAYETFQGTFQSFGQNLRNGQGFWESWSNAGVNALGKVADKLMSMAADNLWNAAFGGKSGAGLLGGLLGASGSSSLPLPGSSSFIGPVAATGRAFNDNSNIIPFANGGAFTNSIVNQPTLFKFANGTGLMGEAGPEAIMPLSRGPNGKLGVSAPGGGGGVHIDASDNRVIHIGAGASSETVAQLKQELASDRAMRKEQVIAIVSEARKQRRL